MYIESTDGSTGRPFYGYAINGVPEAYHYWDKVSSTWKLFTGTQALNVTSDGRVGIGTTTPHSLGNPGFELRYQRALTAQIEHCRKGGHCQSG